MDRLVAAAVGLGDCDAPVVLAPGEIAGEIDGHYPIAIAVAKVGALMEVSKARADPGSPPL